MVHHKTKHKSQRNALIRERSDRTSPHDGREQTERMNICELHTGGERMNEGDARLSVASLKLLMFTFMNKNKILHVVFESFKLFT